MAAMDAYCHPSIAPEPFSLAILEAMRAGLPIAASNAGGVPEAIEDGISGYLVPPNNAVAMARALERIMVKPQTAAQMGKHARQTIADKFTTQHMLKNVSALLQDV
jgi:glycosyltransferase involved in cell wall biosynthesis